MAIHWRLWTRKAHRWAAVAAAAPFLVVIVTGILLQLKKESAWIQPPTQRGQGEEPTISLPQLLEIAKGVPEARVQGWGDIDRIDLQPGRGLAKVLTPGRMELQIDLQTGAVLQVAYRRSDLIEALHDGSWFHDRAKLWVFLPAALLVLGLWVTGICLFALPLVARRAKRRAARERGADDR
jgi:uncharacterized iron-regulated membrane protein